MELRTAIGLRPVISGEPIGPMMNLMPWPAMLLAAAAAPSAVYLLSIATTDTWHGSPSILIRLSRLASAATRSAAPFHANHHWAAGPESTPMTLSFSSGMGGAAY